MSQATEYMDVSDTEFLSHRDINDTDDESEFDSDIEKYFVFSAAKNRLFGRKRTLHVILGSGKTADIILWKDKKMSVCFLCGVTLMWFLFVRMDYTLLSFICDSLILLLSMLFLWTHLASFIDIPPPKVSGFNLPEGFLVKTAISVTSKLNQLLITFGALASGRDMKRFFLVTMTLGAMSILDIWFTAATLFYIGAVTLMIVPAIYERHGDIIDIIGEKAWIELNNRYAELMKKFFGNSPYLRESTPEWRRVQG